jgi:hypothetical protein
MCKIVVFLFFVTSVLISFAQEIDSSGTQTGMDKKQVRKAAKNSRPTYIGIGAGLNKLNFRDFATSPLFYKGNGMVFTLSRLKYDDKFESNLEGSFTSGKYTASSGDVSTQSIVSSVFLDYSHLYNINRWSNEKWNIKAGGKASLTGNHRINPSLNNNSFGMEGFFTLFGSIKATKNFTRKKANPKKFLFVKYGKSTNKRDLSFQLNMTLMNATYRNGYIYSNTSSVNNNPSLYADYSSKVFSGYRISSALNYTLGLTNGNMVMFSYIWDAYKTGGDLDKFEMGNHFLKFTFFFATK